MPRAHEAIVVRAGDQPKSVRQYGEMLRRSFQEIHRVLKRGAFATVVFQATSPDVWKAIIQAGQDAGFELVDVSTLNKGQPSFKQVKGSREGERVAQTDVVLTFSKQASRTVKTNKRDVLKIIHDEFAKAEQAGTPVSVGHLYAVIAAYQLGDGQQPLTFDQVAALLSEHYRLDNRGPSRALEDAVC